MTRYHGHAEKERGGRQTMTGDSFGARATLTVGDTSYRIHRLDAVTGATDLPFCLKILLENMLRTEDGVSVTAGHVTAVAGWDPAAVPAVVDLAAMRQAMRDLGGDPAKINPLVPAELVIDHSVVADVFGRPDAFQ